MSSTETTGTFVEPKKFVLLLGAGASAAYGPPVMVNFMATARRNCAARARSDSDRDKLLDSYQEMMKFHAKCRASSWAFNRNWDNIEELYTQADLLRLTGLPDAKTATQLCQDIAWAIWDVYRFSSGSPPLTRVLEELRKERLE